ncbi:MAG TPA: HAD family hydrolase [Candidatus Aquicultor sp.]|jgi:hydroxymethylpyrimidine pyrophosphatase-like HAD family hydrolase
MYKVVVFDLDGTLRVPDKPVEIGVIEKMHELVGYGMRVSLVSGKDAIYLHGIADGIGIPDPLVGGENGGVIFRPQEKVEIIYDVSPETRRSLDYAKSFLWHRFRDNIWFSPNSSSVTAFVKPILPVSVVYDAVEKFVQTQHLTDVYVLPHWDAVDVLPVGLDKSVFIRYLNSLGFLAREVIAVGDSFNDVPMLRTAGYSMTFEESPDEVKAVANIVAEDIYEAFDIINDLRNAGKARAVGS